MGQPINHAYNDSMTWEYFSAVTLLFSLRVGVSSPPFSEKSVGRTAYFAIFCAREVAFPLAVFMPFSKYAFHLSHSIASAVVVALEPISFDVARACPVSLSEGTPSSSTSTRRQRRMVKNLRLSPIAIQFDKAGMAALNWSSINTGGMFSPPAVIMSSLMRPVIDMKPEGEGISGSSSPENVATSPLCSQPSGSIVSTVLSSMSM
mmetsp:Transcript_28345/g.34526  ORF Transcript_28345/g.34526 Transcript_28345/m.34526 type:complete len:205 (+) Transcript_28345:239-853(+)